MGEKRERESGTKDEVAPMKKRVEKMQNTTHPFLSPPPPSIYDNIDPNNKIVIII